MFGTEWTVVSHLLGWVQARLRAVRDGDRQLGALSLEWIIIAVALAVVAGIATGIFVAKVKSDANSLP
jgi:energy-converting hydrogenase Eha subunit B